MSSLLESLRTHRVQVEGDLKNAREGGSFTAIAQLQRQIYTLILEIAREEAAAEKGSELTQAQLAAEIADGVWALDDAGVEVVAAAVDARRATGRR